MSNFGEFYKQYGMSYVDYKKCKSVWSDSIDGLTIIEDRGSPITCRLEPTGVFIRGHGVILILNERDSESWIFFIEANKKLRIPPKIEVNIQGNLMDTLNGVASFWELSAEGQSGFVEQVRLTNDNLENYESPPVEIK
jgi:hypothetical protein